MTLLLETNMPNLFHRGKIRDTYEMGDKLLMVSTDRISAFDSVLPCGIPDKGTVLNQLSAFWFRETAHLVPNHVIEVVDDVKRVNQTYRKRFPRYIERRSMIVRKAKRIDIECVVRGYLSGSAWAEYKERGTLTDFLLPQGLVENEELPEPIFTPTTKADSGHDQPITIEQMEKLVGRARTQEIIAKSVTVYCYAHDLALPRGIIIADTKMEFGVVDGEAILIDELLTPDSSRFWDAGKYEPGRPQPSFDKQPVRDWLVASGWNKEPPAPMLPPDVIEQTAERYREAYHRLTGKEL